MEDLLNQYKRQNRIFLCWWILCVVTALFPFVSILFSLELSSFSVVIQMILCVASIVGMVLSSVKRNGIVRDIAIIVNSSRKDTKLLEELLIGYGISKREAIRYRLEKPKDTINKNKENSPIYEHRKEYYCCSRCGSDNMVKVKSDSNEFFKLSLYFLCWEA